MKKSIYILLLAALASAQPCMAMKSSKLPTEDNWFIINFSDLSDDSEDDDSCSESTQSKGVQPKVVQSVDASEELFSLPEGSTQGIYKSKLRDFTPPAEGFKRNCNGALEGYVSEKRFNLILDNFLNKCHRDRYQLFDKYDVPEKNIILVGDLHGDVGSVKNILLNHLEEDNVIVFLGDFTDRGANSLETISLLLHAKVLFPDNIFLLRGNHENLEKQMAWSYYKESTKLPSLFSCCEESENCQTLRSQINFIYKDLKTCSKKIINVYNSLPVGLVFDNKQQRIFCCHGCVDPLMIQENGLEKYQEKMDKYVIYDLKDKLEHNILWNRFNEESIPCNSDRALSISDIDNFNKCNSFTFSCFGHVHKNQVTYNKDGKIVGMSLLSVPNFCGGNSNSDLNLAGVLKIDGKSNKLKFISFDAWFNARSEGIPKEWDLTETSGDEAYAFQLPSFAETSVFY